MSNSGLPRTTVSMLLAGRALVVFTDALDPTTAFDAAFKDGEDFNSKVTLLWIGMGTEEPDPFPGAIGAFRAMLDKAGIHHVYFESPGMSHEWQTWRRSLHEFAPRLFYD
jgi:enterochelin esterase-like enzyme